MYLLRPTPPHCDVLQSQAQFDKPVDDGALTTTVSTIVVAKQSESFDSILVCDQAVIGKCQAAKCQTSLVGQESVIRWSATHVFVWIALGE